MPLTNEQLFRSAVTMMAIDGQIESDELGFLQHLQEQLQISKAIFDTAQSDVKQGTIKVHIPEQEKDRRMLLEILVQAACADGRIAPKEQRILDAVAKKIQISTQKLSQMIQAELSKSRHAKEAGPPPPPAAEVQAPTTCPKCRYQAVSPDDPLLGGQNGRGECPSCGIILAKYLKMQADAPQHQDNSEYSIAEFIEKTGQKEDLSRRFELESPYLLEVNLRGQVWTKLGSMIGYTGDITFTREGMMEHGVGQMLKKAMTGEGATLMKMDGRGSVYLADRGKRITILNLDGDTIFVNGNDLLALEKTVAWDITMMRKIGGMLSGGLFNVKLSGNGLVAITTHYTPMTLKVSPGKPVFTDPNATVAWSGSLAPEIKTDISFKTFLGRGSGESIQLKFDGNGWVVLQPFEEVYYSG